MGIQIIINFVKCCRNLSSFAVITSPIPYCNPFERTGFSWKYFEINRSVPKDILWPDLRSLHYAGAAITVEHMREWFNGHYLYHFCYDKTKRSPVERNPCSIIKFEPTSYELGEFFESLPLVSDKNLRRLVFITCFILIMQCLELFDVIWEGYSSNVLLCYLGTLFIALQLLIYFDLLLSII